tara:strand:- start:3719 stop:5212 length:1494 start_codon:yes stop_codon:yes gene_type:complete
LANELKLQSIAGHPLDENLRPIKIQGETSSLEIAKHEKGARVTGDLNVTGDLTVTGSMASDSTKLPIAGGTMTGNLTLGSGIGIDGDVNLDADDTGSGVGIKMLKAGTKIAAFEAHHGYSGLFLYENEGGGSDLCALQCFEHGATALVTYDATGTAAHLTLDADGDIVIDPATGITKFYLAGSTTDYASLTVASNGVTTLTTVDDGVGSSGHLTLDVDGDVVLDPFSGITKFYKNGDTDDYLSITVGLGGIATIATADSDGAVGHLTLDPDGELNLTPVTEVKSDAPLKIKEAANAVADTAAYGQLWVKTATPNQLYFTTDAGDDIQITSGTSTAGGGGGTSRWNVQTGGYKTSLANANYYFQYYPEAYGWFNSETDPTTLDQETDLYSATWIAPADGTLTRMDVFVRATNATDTVQFYVFKGSISEAGSETASLTQIGVSGDCGIDATTKTFHQIATFSSSNTFSQGDGLWIFIKKDSHSVSCNYYFSITISGEYD